MIRIKDEQVIFTLKDNKKMIKAIRPYKYGIAKYFSRYNFIISDSLELTNQLLRGWEKTVFKKSSRRLGIILLYNILLGNKEFFINIQGNARQYRECFFANRTVKCGGFSALVGFALQVLDLLEDNKIDSILDIKREIMKEECIYR